jgi:hypothetical protein
MSVLFGFNHLGFNSPPLAASCHSGESRNPEIYTGCRIRSGMTSDTPLLCGGVVHYVLPSSPVLFVNNCNRIRAAYSGASEMHQESGEAVAEKYVEIKCI